MGFFQFTENDFVSVPIAEGLLLLLAVPITIVAVEDFPRHHMFQHELLQSRLLNAPHIDFGHNQRVRQVCPDHVHRNRTCKGDGGLVTQLPRELLA